MNILLIYPNWIVILILIFLLESNMPLTTYEDFLELSVKHLTDYLSVRGLNTFFFIIFYFFPKTIYTKYTINYNN